MQSKKTLTEDDRVHKVGKCRCNRFHGCDVSHVASLKCLTKQTAECVYVRSNDAPSISQRRTAMLTIRDVARESGVFVATVSRVLNNSAVVTADTRARVMKTIERLGYRPDANAQALANRLSDIIGVVVRDVSDPFFGALVNAVDAVAQSLQMQMVEIAKAFSRDAKIVIMDEPTSSLTEKEVNHLFTIIRKLKDRGCGIIYISHKMEEIFQLCDEITILRDGQWITTQTLQGLDMDKIITIWLGVHLISVFPTELTCRAIPSLKSATCPRCASRQFAMSLSIFVREKSSVSPGWWELNAPILSRPCLVCAKNQRVLSACTVRPLITTAPMKPLIMALRW
ncbi:HTH-type transcriptional repressor mglD [Erwinia sp. Ejp617]|nr:HTH-type transcriptional repressor mglD [Erwinia sp. Ejp617]